MLENVGFQHTPLRQSGQPSRLRRLGKTAQNGQERAMGCPTAIALGFALRAQLFLAPLALRHRLHPPPAHLEHQAEMGATVGGASNGLLNNPSRHFALLRVPGETMALCRESSRRMGSDPHEDSSESDTGSTRCPRRWSSRPWRSVIRFRPGGSSPRSCSRSTPPPVFIWGRDKWKI